MADEITQILADSPFPIESSDLETPGGMGFSTIFNLLGEGDNAPPVYWSRNRDVWLRNFARTSDPIKVALKTYISKASTIPIRVVPKDASVSRYVRQAEMMSYALRYNSGFMRGFSVEFQKFLFDYLTQDNGAFLMILGGGEVTGPIVGAASGVVHLESSRCSRTRNPIYPVVYYHDDGKRYKIHYTRVLDLVSMPSSELELNGIGHCPVSLCVDGAIELRSIVTYSLEKLGTRPARQVLYAKTGATIEQLNAAVGHWTNKLNNEQLTAFAKTLLLAPLMPGGKLELDMIDLASTPDGFDRQSVALLNMALIAAAFGLDLRDLAYSFGVSGQTRSDAEVQDRKGRGKGVGELIEVFAEKLTKRFLPDHLTIVFDNIDDSQDEQVARIRSERAMARSRDIAGGVLTERAARLAMLRDGELTEAEFEEMEQGDGRLVSGVSILTLFNRTDLPYARALAVEGVADITDITANDPDVAIAALHRNWLAVSVLLEGAATYDQQRAYKRCLAAIEYLSHEYREAGELEAKAEQDAQNAMLQGARNAGVQPKKGPADDGRAPFGRQAPRLSEVDTTKEVARVSLTRARFRARHLQRG